MNQQETLQQMRALNLSGMLSAYQNILNMPLQMQPPIDQLLAQLLDAEYLERANRKTESYIRAAHFRYQAMIGCKSNTSHKEGWTKILLLV